MGKPKNEFTFILIDTSESMNQMSIRVEDDDEKKKKKHFGGRSDTGTISKFEAAIQASKAIVLTKKRIVDTDKFGIVTYNDNGSSLVQELTADHNLLVKALDTLKMGATITPEKRGKLAGAFSMCIQEFAKQLKFVGNLMLRVFVLTDDMHREGISPEERRLTEINRDIGVYIDILYFGTDPDNQGVDDDADADGFFSEGTGGDEDASLAFELDGTGNEALSSEDKQFLEEQGLLIPGLQPEKKAAKAAPVQKKRKRRHNDIRFVTDSTDGLFLDGKQNTGDVLKHARKLGDIKDLEEGLDAFESAPVRKKKLISAIAEELVPLDITEIQAVSEGKSDLKCNICFQKTTPYQLRRCSYCKREMHLACVMKWAEQDQDKEESFVFRCPFCFHLLKVDPTLSKLMDLQTVRQNVAKIQAGKEKKQETTASMLNPSQILSLPEPCEVCGILLEEDDKVYQCNNCGVAYHEACFNHMLQASHNSCRRCGYQFASW